MKDNKKKLGQFYTTNYEYILQNMSIPDGIKSIIEPFAGKGDLIDFINNFGEYDIECYDIDPKKDYIKKRDTLLYPPDYNGKFIITNPPYLARNKCSDKNTYNKYGTNDLYKCLIKELINNNVIGGILILPLNFWCSIRKQDILLRKDFLKNYAICLINVFEEKVFSDTSYSVCSFQFKKIDLNLDYSINNNIDTYIYPKKTKIILTFNEDNKYTLGGDIYKLPQNNKIKVYRLTKDNINSEYITNMLLKCIDDSDSNKISLKMVLDKDRYIDKTTNLSARSYASIIIEPKITIDEQKILVDKFNKYLNEQRNIYNSLFLTNYRESKNIARKRISFTLSFEIINYLLNEIIIFC
jgi:hypothetical protein